MWRDTDIGIPSHGRVLARCRKCILVYSIESNDKMSPPMPLGPLESNRNQFSHGGTTGSLVSHRGLAIGDGAGAGAGLLRLGNEAAPASGTVRSSKPVQQQSARGTRQYNP